MKKYRSRTIEELETTFLDFLQCMKDELMSKLEDLKADFADYASKVDADHEALKAQIESLKGQVGGVSDADLQGVIDSIDAAKAKLDPAPVAAPVEAPVAPVEAAPAPEAPVEAPAPEVAPEVAPEAPAETPAQ